MKLLIFFQISVILALVSCATMTDLTSTTDWTDPTSGTKYDFSSLKKDPK
jgi:hypothetical protein